jgi:hypothetical protein
VPFSAVISKILKLCDMFSAEIKTLPV